jgi:hypothetical protein
MIDPDKEQLIPVSDVPALVRAVPALVGGCTDRVSALTVWRWRAKGDLGVRLEEIVLDGRGYTSVEALSRFEAARSARRRMRWTP